MDANNIMTDIPLHVYEPEEEDYSVYIVLSKTQTLPSRVIKLWTREPYAHTSLAMDVELKEMCDDLEIIYEGKLRNYRNYLKLHFLRDAETGDYIVN